MRIEDPNDPDPSRQAGAAFMDPFSEVDRSFRTTPTWTGARAIVYIYIFIWDFKKTLQCQNPGWIIVLFFSEILLTLLLLCSSDIRKYYCALNDFSLLTGFPRNEKLNSNGKTQLINFLVEKLFFFF